MSIASQLAAHPDVTPDMIEQIDQIIEAHKNSPGPVIPALRECQEVVGYLPVEVIDYIGRGLNIPPSDVYGVATFYALFSLTPKGRHKIRACLGTACYVKGIKEVIGRIRKEFDLDVGETTEDRRFSLEGVRCLGACGLAPVMVVDQETYGGVKPDQVSEILQKYE
ncbi:MAG: NADH-quinone oxidoreductase subunit NuoE [Desulfobacterales bacterium]